MITKNLGRNDPCSCGSGKKLKKCCGQQASNSIQHAKKSPADLFQEGLRFHKAGMLAEAEQVYRTTLQVQKDHVDALNLLGVLCHQTGRSDEGGALVQQAVTLKPDHLDAVTNLGNILKDLGFLDNAVGCYEHALSVNKNYALAHCNLGATLTRMGRHSDAISHLKTAIALMPSLSDAYLNLGEALERHGQTEGAIEAYKHFLTTTPKHPIGRLNLADCLKKTNRTAAAASLYQEIIADTPDFILPYNNLGNLLREEGQLEEATSLFLRAIKLAPQTIELYTNLAAVLISRNLLDEALSNINKAYSLASAPGNSTPTTQLADIHYIKSLALLVRGELQEGFKEYEWRWGCNAFRRSQRDEQIPLWQGTPLAGGTLAVHYEQGFGDTLQFARYGCLLRQLAGDTGTIRLECQPELVSLLSGVTGFDEVIAAGTSGTTADLQVSLMSLPHLFATSLATIPNKTPYIVAPEGKTTIWYNLLRQQIPSGLRVGVAWAGNKDHQNDRNRSIPLSLLSKLANTPEVSLISLQKSVDTTEWEKSAAEKWIYNYSANLEDFTDTAALIEVLDLVITVDTSIAHLSGAMNKPTWVMLPFAPDWRWMMAREDSPWYPSIKLFRQKAPANWEAVLTDVKQALQDRVAAKPN